MKHGPRLMATTLSDRVTALEISQSGVSDRLDNLANDVRAAQHDSRADIEKFAHQMQSELDAIKAQLGSMSKTNWPVLFGAAALAMTIAGSIAGMTSVIGSLAYSSIVQRVDGVEQRLTKEMDIRVISANRTLDDVTKRLDRVQAVIETLPQTHH